MVFLLPEPQAAIYEYLNCPPRTIILQLREYPRDADEEDSREKGYYLTSSARPPVTLSVNHYSRA
jgi:hypothetical protein